MLYTHRPLTHFLEAWTAEHFGRHDDPAWQAYLKARQKYHAIKTAEQAAAHDNGGLLGMSGAGSCLRALAAKRAKMTSAPLSGAELVTFEIGHLGEVVILAVLEAAGFILDGTQTEARLGNTHKSAADAVLVGGPVDLPYPLVLSCKTSAYKQAGYSKGRKKQDRRGFSALPVGGVYKEQFSWYAQLELELAALKLEHGLVVVLVKDRVASWEGDEIMKDSGSLAWYAELLPFNRGFAENLWHAHRKLIRDFGEFPMSAPAQVPKAGELEGEIRWVDLPLPGDGAGWGGLNKEATGDWNPCFQCSYRAHCAAENTLEDQLRRSLEATDA